MPWSDVGQRDDGVTQIGFESIGRLVLELRRRAGLTQRELQQLSGVDQAVISRIENGKQHGISWWRFGRLIGALGGIGPSAPPPRPPWPGFRPPPTTTRADAADSHTGATGHQPIAVTRPSADAADGQIERS